MFKKIIDFMPAILLCVAILLSFSAFAHVKESSNSVARTLLTQAELQRIAAYETYWLLGGATAEMSDEQALQLAAESAREEFASRGPALAAHFLTHQQVANNTAWFFLLRAVGDMQTADILIRALPNPPEAFDSVLQRHSSEIEAAIDGMLEEESLRSDPLVLNSLNETLSLARALAWGDYAAELLVSLIGRLRTPQALKTLEKLVADSDPAIRKAAAAALGRVGLPAAEPALEVLLSGDQNAEVRKEAAEALGKLPADTTVSVLKQRIGQEQDLQAVDAILRSIVLQNALPTDPQSCLEYAEKGWDLEIIAPYFRCWRDSATQDDVIRLALSGSWPIRALALQALTLVPHDPRRTLVISRSATTSPLALDEAVRHKLLESAVEIYSHDIAGIAKPDSISHETARLTREAFWEIAGRNMELAVSYADRIKPISGRYTHIGSFGMSSYISGEAPEAYAAVRRPVQLLGLSVVFGLGLVLTMFGRTRQLGAGLAAGAVIWLVWLLFQTGVDAFPPPPMWLVSVYGIGFLMAGLSAGVISSLAVRAWVKVIIAPLLGGFSALAAYGLVLANDLYPIGSGGWELFLAPIACALIALPMALFISIGLMVLPRKGHNT